MTMSVKDYAIKCVKEDLGNAEDNLYRAMSAAKRNDPMKEWGESGTTLQQIIDGYQNWKDRAEQTLIWLQSLNV